MLIGHRIQSKTCRPTPWPALTSARDGLFSEPEGAPNDTGYMRKLVKSQSDPDTPFAVSRKENGLWQLNEYDDGWLTGSG